MKELFRGCRVGRRTASGLGAMSLSGSETGSRGRGLFFRSLMVFVVVVVPTEATELHRGRGDLVGDEPALTLLVGVGTCSLAIDGTRDGQTEAASSKTPAATGEMMEYASADMEYCSFSTECRCSVSMLDNELRRL